MNNQKDKHLKIAIVGPCSSGKSTLAQALMDAGYTVRQPAQEHSLVPDMWRQMSRPDILIYLDVDYAHARQRRPYHDGGQQRLAEQQKRLAHARQHSHFYLDTNGLSPENVRDEVLHFLRRQEAGGIRPGQVRDAG